MPSSAVNKEAALEDLSTKSNDWLESERRQCLVDLNFAKKLGRNKDQIAARFNLLTRELNSRSEG